MADEIYINKVGIMLDRLKVGEVFDMDKNVKAETRAEFISVVQGYISRNMGIVDNTQIEFNGSFDDPQLPAPSKIRKISIKHEKQKHEIYTPSALPATRSRRKN